ncbi:MAG: ATP-binding cassette domain-containing protein [Prevotellaceae bacterium]|nr:ATP-binding cassette domain-containing protein [Prevotellaceae bacterium]
MVQIKNPSTTIDGYALSDSINFDIVEGEHVALLGGVATGKTTLLKLLAGRLPVLSGSITVYDLGKISDGAYVFQKENVAFVSFDLQFLNADSYYQQRFNSEDAIEQPTLSDFFKNAERNDYFENIISLLGLTELLLCPLITLSSGQMRKSLIARALLCRPKLLLLDNPFAGLDAKARDLLKELLRDICDSVNLTLVLACSRISELPSHVRKIVELPYRYDYNNTKNVSFTSSAFIGANFNTAVEFKNVCVSYGEKVVLDNISFAIRQGEKWALLGSNGVGKSTIMSLIYGDHPQAYANEIILFDRTRGSGESIWDIKKHIGYCSPELHAYFHEPLSCFDVITTGLNNNFIPKKNLNPEERDFINQLLKYYGAESLSKRNFLRISSGEQRLILLLRAFSRNADMLILDEPFQCFDDNLVEASKSLIDTLISSKTLLFTSHYKAELPESIGNILNL